MSYFSTVKFSEDAITKALSGALRVAQLTTLFDGKTLGSDDTSIFETVGTGTGAWANNKYNMSVTTGQYMIRRSRRYFPYFSGKPQVVEHTFDNFQTEANVVKEAGYLSTSPTAPHSANYDGFILRDDGTTKRIMCFRDGVETINVPYANWDNKALLDTIATDYGTNWSNFNVLFWDFLWLGGAGLRLWIATPIGFVLAHSVKYVGLHTDSIFKSPNLALHYAIRSTTGTGSFRYICSQVATEGSINEAGKTWISRTPQTGLACNSVSNQYVIMSVRKIVSHRDTPIEITRIACMNTGASDKGLLSLIINPAIVGGTLTYTPHTSGRFEYAHSASPTILVTPNTGTEICCIPAGYDTSSDEIRQNFLSWLGSTITNVMDEFVLVYSPVTTNQTVVGIMTGKHY